MSLRFVLTTWNVGGASGSSSVPSGAEDLLPEVCSDADVALIGLQEVQRPGAGWKAALKSTLPSDWAVRAGCRYGGMRILVLVRNRVRNRVVPMRAMRVGSGVADRWPNKGAVAVDFKVDERTTMCFVVAHLAAQEGNVHERQQDWVKIVRRLQNSDNIEAESAGVPLFLRYDHVFVMGDLNYRLAPTVGTTPAERVAWVEDRVKCKDWEALAEVDELANERRKSNVFVNFQEGPLRFPPTFKYDPGAPHNGYNTSRIPSYCDRILWHSLPARRPSVALVSYTALNDIVSSDHRPAQAVFDIEAPARIARLPLISKRGRRLVLEFTFVRFKKNHYKKARLRKDSKLPASVQSTRKVSVSAVGKSGPSIAVDPSSPAERHSTKSRQMTSSRGNFFDPQPSMTSKEAVTLTEYCDKLANEGIRCANIYEEIDDDTGYDSTSSSSSGESYESTGSNSSSSSSSSTSSGSSFISPSTLPTAQDCANTDVLIHRFAYCHDGKLVEHGSLDLGRRTEAENLQDQPSIASCRHSRSLSCGEKNGCPRVVRLDGTVSTSSDDELPNIARLAVTDSPYVSSRHWNHQVASCSPEPHLPVCDVDRQPHNPPSHSRTRSGPEAAEFCVSNRGICTDGADEPVTRNSFNRSRAALTRKEAKRWRRRQKPFSGWLMGVYGSRVFLKPRRVYHAEIHKQKDGFHECVADMLPAIPLYPVSSYEVLKCDHIQISFWRASTRLGYCGVLPLSEVLKRPVGETYCFELHLTKYGKPAGKMEAGVRLIASDSQFWKDAAGQVVRGPHGQPAKEYRDCMNVRKKPEKVRKISSHAARTAQSARAVKKLMVHQLDAFGTERISNRLHRDNK